MSISEKVLPQTTNDFTDQAARFLMTWTPRVIVAAVAGYYSLGIAYDWGVMASIDRIAIPILRDSVGYAGLGAAMPTFQWYSAWGVRTAAAAAAGLMYDLTERLIVFIYYQVKDRYFPTVEITPSLSQTAVPWIRA